MKTMFAKDKRKRLWGSFLVLLVLAFLLTGGIPLKGKQVFYISYDKDVISSSRGYLRTENDCIYTGDPESSILLQVPEGTRGIVLKFSEEARQDVPVSVRFSDVSDTETGTAETVWKAGRSALDIAMPDEQTRLVELSVPADFLVERCMYWFPFRWMRRGLAVMGAGFAAAVILTLLLNGTGPGRKLLEAVIVLLQRIRGLFRRERMKKDRLIWCSFAVILLAGTLYTFLSPPLVYAVQDEQIHFKYAVSMAEPAGGFVTLSDYDAYTEVSAQRVDKTTYKWETRRTYSRFLNWADREGYWMDPGWRLTDRKQTLCYLPYTFAQMAGRALRIPWTIRLMLGKWVNVWLLAVLCALGMRHLKSGKLVVPMIALMPGVVFLAAGYTYDTWITAWFIYGLCVLYGELQRPDDPMTVSAALKILIPLFLADLPKLIYFPIIFIAFFVPKSKFRTAAARWGYKLAALFTTALPLLMLYVGMFAGGRSGGSGDARGTQLVNPGQQIQGILNDPGRFAAMMARFLPSQLNPYGRGMRMATQIGYLGQLRWGAVIVTIVIAAAFLSNDRKETGKFPWWYRLGHAAVYASVCFLAAFSMYVVFTEVGLDKIMGYQNRYLIPAAFPTLFVLSRLPALKWAERPGFAKTVQVTALAAMLAVNVLVIVMRILSLY